jgi:hypothetical protein
VYAISNVNSLGENLIMKYQKFRLSKKAMAWECSVVFFAILFLSITFCIGTIVLAISKEEEAGALRVVLPIIFGLPALVITIASFALVFTAIGRAIFSYLLVSGDGLEYCLWPMHKIRCTWDDVDQIKKSFLPFQGDILMLKSAEVSSFQKVLLSFNKGNFGVVKTVPVIPLFQINGWPNGKLENELRKYAPNLFIDRVTSNSNKLQ